ncbi:MAG: hypothetical protein V4443_09880 [Pseudomonadota bacterium]
MSSSTAKSAVTQTTKLDGFSPFHVLLQLALVTLFFANGALHFVFDLGLFLIVIAVGLIWFVSIVVSLRQAKWRRLASAVAAPFIIFLLVMLLSHWRIDPQWARFEFNKRSYEETVRSIEGPHPHRFSWNWNSIQRGPLSSTIFNVLVFDESDEVLHKDGKKEEGGVSSVRSFGNHFYLVTTIY